MGLARDQIERPDRRRPPVAGEVVIAHREALRVIPERGHRIPVVVAHDDGGIALGEAGLRRHGMIERNELVHEPAVDRLLLVHVAMILGALDDAVASEAERVHIHLLAGHRVHVVIGIVHQQLRVLPVVLNHRRVRLRVERDFAAKVLRNRVGPEVLIERAVLIEDHDQVLDRCARRPVGGLGVAAPGGKGDDCNGHERDGGHSFAPGSLYRQPYRQHQRGAARLLQRRWIRQQWRGLPNAARLYLYRPRL